MKDFSWQPQLNFCRKFFVQSFYRLFFFRADKPYFPMIFFLGTSTLFHFSWNSQRGVRGGNVADQQPAVQVHHGVARAPSEPTGAEIRELR